MIPLVDHKCTCENYVGGDLADRQTCWGYVSRSMGTVMQRQQQQQSRSDSWSMQAGIIKDEVSNKLTEEAMGPRSTSVTTIEGMLCYPGAQTVFQPQTVYTVRVSVVILMFSMVAEQGLSKQVAKRSRWCFA